MRSTTAELKLVAKAVAMPAAHTLGETGIGRVKVQRPAAMSLFNVWGHLSSIQLLVHPGNGSAMVPVVDEVKDIADPPNSVPTKHRNRC